MSVFYRDVMTLHKTAKFYITRTSRLKTGTNKWLKVLKSESEDEILERILHFFELKGYLLLSKPYSEILPFFARHNKKKNKPIKPTNLPDV